MSALSQELHAFFRACVHFFRDETALQLLEVVIHHGEIKPLGGWQAWERLENLAILRRLTARYQLQVCNPPPAHSTIQTTCAFSGRLFLVNHLLHDFSGVLRTLLHEALERFGSRAVNAIRHWKHVVTITYKVIKWKAVCNSGMILCLHYCNILEVVKYIGLVQYGIENW